MVQLRLPVHRTTIGPFSPIGPTISCETITLKYFKQGHTFIATGDFHKQVEDEKVEDKDIEVQGYFP